MGSLRTLCRTIVEPVSAEPSLRTVVENLLQTRFSFQPPRRNSTALTTASVENATVTAT